MQARKLVSPCRILSLAAALALLGLSGCVAYPAPGYGNYGGSGYYGDNGYYGGSGYYGDSGYYGGGYYGGYTPGYAYAAPTTSFWFGFGGGHGWHDHDWHGGHWH